MEQQAENKIFFMESIQNYDARRHSQCVIHILCTRGSMSFRFQNVHYNIVAGDYVILTNMSLASGFSESEDYCALTMGLPEPFVLSMAIRNNYGIIGHLSLLQNPVMRLSPHDFRKCVSDMERLRERLTDSEPHLFREEMLGYLLMAHILDLYDIHARGQASRQVSEHTARLLQQFIGLLYDGEYIRHRDVPYYASRLRTALRRRIHPAPGRSLLRLPPLRHAPLPLRDMQEGVRQTGDLLDRPLHPA